MSLEFNIKKKVTNFVSRILKRGKGNTSNPICHKKIGPANERKIMLLMWFYIGSLIAMKTILWSMYTKYMEFLQQETHYMEEDENIILTVTDFKSKRYIAEYMKHMTSV